MFYNEGVTSNISTLNTGKVTPIVPLWFDSTTGSAPHGPQLYCGVDPEVNGKEGYFWVDRGATISITQSIASPTDSVDLFAYHNAADTSLATLAFGSTPTISFTISNTVYPVANNNGGGRGGYFRLVYNTVAPEGDDSSQGVKVTIQNQSNSDVYAHLALPNVANHLNHISRMRVNAASMLIRNMASSIAKNGSMQCASFEEGTDWRGLIGVQQLINYAAIQNTYQGGAETGSYSFLHSGGQNDFSWFAYVNFDEGSTTPTQVQFPLKHCRFVCATASCTTQGGQPGLNFFVHNTSAIEFQTNDQWYDARPPSASFRDTVDAIQLVRRETQFFENPSHLAKIGSFLSHFAKEAEEIWD